MMLVLGVFIAGLICFTKEEKVLGFENKFNLTSVFLLSLPHININFDIDL